MNMFQVSQDNYISHTLVPNRFIDEYLAEANDAQIKIYLYLLRTINAHKATGISDIADIFNYTEQDVIRALRYWEKKHLLSLTYDADKNLCGIRIEHLSESASESKQTGAEIISIHKTAAEKSEKPSRASSFDKPVYSLDRLSAFQKREETKQLMFAIQTYIGRPLSQSNVATILFLSDTLHFSNDLIDYLIQYCVERDKKDFRYIERVAITWAENGVTSPKEAARCCTRYDRTVYDIMRALGKSGTPTEREVSFIRKWTKDYSFVPEIIMEACDRTVLATDKHRFEYADGILSNWHGQHVQTKEDISALDASHRAASKTISGTSSRSGSDRNKFNQFKQNTYDFGELEKEILSN